MKLIELLNQLEALRDALGDDANVNVGVAAGDWVNQRELVSVYAVKDAPAPTIIVEGEDYSALRQGY